MCATICVTVSSIFNVYVILRFRCALLVCIWHAVLYYLRQSTFDRRACGQFIALSVYICVQHARWQRSSPSRGSVSDIRYLSFKRVHPRQKLSPGGRQKPSKVGNDASRRPCRRRHRSVLPIVSSRILMTRLTRRQRRKKTRPVWRLPTLTQWRKSGGNSGDAGADSEGSVAVVKVRGAQPPCFDFGPPARIWA